MSLELATNKKTFLQDRAHMLAQARIFFAERGVLEVDCGALIRFPSLDANIDCIGVDQDQAFLHTSPEYALKRLLSDGIGDCYFLGHVYRKNELGSLHNPEFTMAEWYRQFSFADMIQETAEFLFLFFGEKPIEILPYRKAFETYVGIDYSAISLSDLQKMCGRNWERDTCIHYLLTHKIEPELGQDKLTVLTDYPPHEAALARLITKQGEQVAERYEIYHQGVELANGFHELANGAEQRARFQERNQERIAANKAPYPLDEQFLASLDRLPDCCGVALGFDRALMLRHNLRSIKPILPFAWDET